MMLLYILGAVAFVLLVYAVALGVTWGEREDLGSVSPGYRREKGWGRR